MEGCWSKSQLTQCEGQVHLSRSPIYLWLQLGFHWKSFFSHFYRKGFRRCDFCTKQRCRLKSEEQHHNRTDGADTFSLYPKNCTRCTWPCSMFKYTSINCATQISIWADHIQTQPRVVRTDNLLYVSVTIVYPAAAGPVSVSVYYYGLFMDCSLWQVYMD